MIAPSQEEIDTAAEPRAARHAGKTIDVKAQPPVARLEAPSAKPDTSSE